MSNAEYEKAHEAKELDLSGVTRGVWLVKVPKYLSEAWNGAKPNSDIGKLTITTTGNEKPEVCFTLSNELERINNVPSTNKFSIKKPIPKKHKFVLTGISNQCRYVMNKEHLDPENDKLQLKAKMSIEGKIIQRAECIPINDDKYMSLKRSQIESSNRPLRKVVRLENVVTMKPVSAHASILANEAKKKEMGKKSRLDKDRVMDMVFSAFEKHQYYNIKDLETLTRQPSAYLKELLKEFCNYNMKKPHRNMWELKPEYRHYTDTKEE